MRRSASQTVTRPHEKGHPAAPIRELVVVSGLVLATEAAAMAAARWLGRGDPAAARAAASEAMRRTIGEARLRGRVVVALTPPGEASLRVGEQLGGGGAEVDLAIGELEGATLLARGEENATVVIAATEPGGLMPPFPGRFEQLVVGAPAAGKVDLDRPIAENLAVIAATLDRHVADLTVVVLDGPEAVDLAASVRQAGARIKLTAGGAVPAALSVAISNTGVHAVIGTTDVATAIVAAAGVRCIGGEMLGRIAVGGAPGRRRSSRVSRRREGLTFRTEDLVGARQLAFVITGVSGGGLLNAVRFGDRSARTQSLVMLLGEGEVGFLDTTHVEPGSVAPIDLRRSRP